MGKVLLLLGLVLAATSCTETATDKDQVVADNNLARLQQAQPAPNFEWSQIRQNLIEINRAQAQTTQTTSFFFNQGVASPISSCPSIGFPIPTTTQLTNPDKIDNNSSGSDQVIAQSEQTGIYTGDSTGTYVICVNAQGKAYAIYWEGFVNTVSGPAEWNQETGQVELIGQPSFEFTKEK